MTLAGKFSNWIGKYQWLLLLVSLTYLPFLDSPFFFDDLHFFKSMVRYYASSAFHLDLRWFSYASLGWTELVFSDAVPLFFRFGNALIHFCCVMLLYLFARDLLRLLFPELPTEVAERGAMLSATLFAVHPVAVYAVGYVVQRSILMATFFGLLLCWVWLRAISSGQAKWTLLAVVAYFLACFSKEHSALLPLVLVALHILLRGHNCHAGKGLWWSWIGFFAIFTFVALRAKGVFGVPYEAMAERLFEQQGVVAGSQQLHLLSVLTQAGLFFKYLWLWVLPNPAWMSVDMREPFISAFADWRGWLGAVAYLAYGAVALRWLWQGGRRGLAGFALLYPWLLFPIEFASIRVQEPFVLYRSYLWAPGLLLLASMLPMRLSRSRATMLLLLSVILLLPLSWNRLWVFADNFRMWDDAVRLLRDEKAAGADRIYFNRGQELIRARKWQEATLDFERVVAISPQLAPPHILLGTAYIELGRSEDAMKQIDLALTLNPSDDRPYYLKAILLRRQGRAKESKEWLKRGCERGNLSSCLLAL